jgi:autotransporter-associated beta strand protein
MRKFILICLATLLSVTAFGEIRQKRSGQALLNNPNSWRNGTVPTAADTASWDSYTSDNSGGSLGANLSFAGISFSNPSGNQSIGNTAGATLTLGTGGIDMSNPNRNFDIDCALALGGAQTWTVGNSKMLTLGRPIANGGFALTLAGNGSTVMNRVLSGTGGLTINATGGQVTLSSSNSYSGGTTLIAGQLNLNYGSSSDNTHSAIGVGTLTINGGSLDNTSGASVTMGPNNQHYWNGDFTFIGSNPLSLRSGPVTLGGYRVVTVDASFLTVSGVISGNYGLSKMGAGTLALAGVNTFTAGLRLNAGQLNINNAQALGTTAGTFTIYGGTIANTTASAITTLNYPQDWNGNFIFGNTTSDLNLGTGSVMLGGNRTVTVTDHQLTVGGGISGSYSLTKAGNGTLTLSGANTFTGATTVNGGTLLVNGSLAVGSDVSVNTSATLGGIGTIDGSTTINSGTLSPGPGIGTMAFGNTLSLSGATVMEINKVNTESGPVLTGDRVAVTSGTLVYGGYLTVTATGDALEDGDTFGLFDAPSFSGSFYWLNLPALPSRLQWNTSRLTTEGAISVECAPAIANAGPNQAICGTIPNVTLAGSFGGGASSATWSGGAGTFSPNNTTTNATYGPTAEEIAAGQIRLTLTTDDPGGACAPAVGDVEITFNRTATVNTGPGQTITAGNNVKLAGSVGGTASSGAWTTSGTGTFSPNNTSMNATYIPTSGDIAAGQVTLTLTTDNPAGGCSALSAAMTVTISPLTIPNISTQPTDVTVQEWAPTTLSVGAAGGNLTYQWRRNGVNINGATDSTLMLDNVRFTDAGIYSVVIVNGLGQQVSQLVRLTVWSPCKVAAWGLDTSGQVSGGGFPATLNNAVGIAAGYIHSLALLDDGTVTGWGYDDPTYHQITGGAGLVNVVAIAAGGNTSMALKSDGTVAAWGEVTGMPPDLANPNLAHVVFIAVGQNYCLALKRNGTVLAWGGDTAVVNGAATLTDVVALSAADDHAAALKSDGSVVLWGSRSGVPVGLPASQAVAGGSTFDASVLRTAHSAYVWDPNLNQQTFNGASDVVSLSGGRAHLLALNQNGTVAAWYDAANNGNQYGQATGAPAGLDVRAVAAGHDHSLALYVTGTYDNDSDTLADWWEWKHFGGLSQTANTDYDGDGSLDGADSTDPNTIQFSITLLNDYVHTSLSQVTLNVAPGQPARMAVVVDSSDFATAAWKTYQANPTVDLGTVEGWHTVSIGLRGLAQDVAPVWRTRRLKLDLTPPVLTITNPVGSTVTQPIVQLQGHSSEPLGSVWFDLVNTGGTQTEGEVLVLRRYYDTTASEFTTTTFQAFDVGLVEGVNTFTVHAADRAGNVASVTKTITLNYSTKTAPTIQLEWPTNHMEICSDTFTWRGMLDDPTATVSASIETASGETTNLRGIVERSGKFWVENIPLALSGTSTLTLSATDVRNQTSTTNIVVTRGTIELTMDPVSPSLLWRRKINLTGRVPAGYSVWVNGVKGHNPGDGTWHAENVPINAGGTASFIIAAYAGNEQQPDGSFGNPE